MPKKVCIGHIFHVMTYAFVFKMPQKRTVSVSLFFMFEIWFWNAPIFESKILRMIRKWGITRLSIIVKVGHFKEKRMIRFQTGKREGDISQTNAYHMPSRAKYVLHIIFGTFQVTSRKTVNVSIYTVFV